MRLLNPHSVTARSDVDDLIEILFDAGITRRVLLKNGLFAALCKPH
jgi:hypothetical protein